MPIEDQSLGDLFRSSIGEQIAREVQRLQLVVVLLEVFADDERGDVSEPVGIDVEMFQRPVDFEGIEENSTAIVEKSRVEQIQRLQMRIVRQQSREMSRALREDRISFEPQIFDVRVVQQRIADQLHRSLVEVIARDVPRLDGRSSGSIAEEFSDGFGARSTDEIVSCAETIGCEGTRIDSHRVTTA